MAETDAPLDLDHFRHAFADATPDAVIVADHAGIIRFWNDGAARLFGFAREEAIGQSLDIIIPESLRARHWSGFDNTMKTGQSRYGAGDVLAVPGLRKDGSRVSLEFTVMPLHDKAGRMVGIAATLRDVTKRFEEVKMLRAKLAASKKP